MTPIPENSEQFAEFFNDAGRVTAAIREGQLGDIVDGYVRKQLAAANADLPRQLNEQLQLGLQSAMQDFAAGSGGLAALAAPQAQLAREAIAREAAQVRVANRTMSMRQAAARQKLFNRAAPGAPLDAEFGADANAFFRNVVASRRVNTEDLRVFERRNNEVRNAMRESVPSEGGFLVPENLRSQLLMLALENSIVRPRARVIPMDSLRVPYPTIDDPTHVSQVFGGVVGYWTEEAAALTASQPTFGRIVLEARKLTAYTEVPNELLEDSIEALEQFIGEIFPEALAFFEDYAFINGDGVAQPLGILNATSAVVTGGGAGGERAAANSVEFSDIVAMFARMLPQSLNSAVWICSPDVIAQLLQLVLGTLGGSGTSAVAPPLWLQSMSAAEGPQYSILGRPLIVSEKMPKLGATGDIAFVDFSYYLLGDRQALQVANSAEYKFQNDITAFRMIERLDGRPWLRSALTPANGSANTLSPIVVLNGTAA